MENTIKFYRICELRMMDEGFDNRAMSELLHYSKEGIIELIENEGVVIGYFQAAKFDRESIYRLIKFGTTNNYGYEINTGSYVVITNIYIDPYSGYNIFKVINDIAFKYKKFWFLRNGIVRQVTSGKVNKRYVHR